jgi:hypothetical protein
MKGQKGLVDLLRSSNDGYSYTQHQFILIGEQPGNVDFIEIIGSNKLISAFFSRSNNASRRFSLIGKPKNRCDWANDDQDSEMELDVENSR